MKLLKTTKRARRKPPATSVKAPRCLAIVEDDPFVREAWAQAELDVRVLLFACPRDFWAEHDRNPEFLADVVAVVTDHHFANDGELGMDFAVRLRMSFDRPILLASDGVYDDAELRGIDRRVAKTPQSLKELKLA